MEIYGNSPVTMLWAGTPTLRRDDCMLMKMFQWLIIKTNKQKKNQTFRQLQRGYGGLGKEWGRKGSSYAQEAVPQR